MTLSDDDLGVVYLDELKPREEPILGSPRPLRRNPRRGSTVPPPPRGREPRIPMGVDVSDLPDCVGGCGYRGIQKNAYDRLTPAQRQELVYLGIRRIATRHLCSPCYNRVKKDGTLSQYPVSVNPNDWLKLEAKHDIPTIWAEVLAAGGGYKHLAERVGTNAGTAYDAVKRLGLPEPMTSNRVRNKARTEFLQELHQLVRFGVGTHDIAKAFSLTDDELIQKVNGLRDRGFTTVDLRYPEMEYAA